MSVKLSSTQRRALRAAAHSLNPVVAIAQHGLSASVLAEIERSLGAHELIKIRVFGEDRTMREALLAQICEAVSAEPVQHIGNILVIYRAKPQTASDAPPEAKPGPKARPARGARESQVASAPRRRASTTAGKLDARTGQRKQPTTRRRTTPQR